MFAKSHLLYLTNYTNYHIFTFDLVDILIKGLLSDLQGMREFTLHKGNRTKKPASECPVHLEAGLFYLLFVKHRELKIPIALARHILRNKRHPQFRVWLALKAVHGAFVKKSRIDKQQVANICGFSNHRTVDYHLKKLLEWNWVGENETDYFFRPVSFLCQQYGVSPAGKGHIIDLKKQLTEIQSLLFAVAVKNLIMYRYYLGRINGTRHKQGCSDYQIQYYNAKTLSVRLIAKLIGISVNMVHRLKMKARQLGYMQISNNSRLVLPYEHAYLFEHYKEYLFPFGNVLKIRLTDELNPNILVK